MIKGLCEKAVWFVWDLFLKVKEYFVGQEVITLSKEKRYRTMEGASDGRNRKVLCCSRGPYINTFGNIFTTKL